MLLTHYENALPVTQTECPHSIIKNTSINGVSQQIIKQSNGNFLNPEYELIHNIDL